MEREREREKAQKRDKEIPRETDIERLRHAERERDMYNSTKHNQSSNLYTLSLHRFLQY